MRRPTADGGDGVVCDRCGADLGNGSAYDAVSVAGLDADAEHVTLHFGLPDRRCGCASRVFTARATAWRVEHGGGAVTWMSGPPAVQ